jgi:hypothetical protein
MVVVVGEEVAEMEERRRECCIPREKITMRLLK